MRAALTTRSSFPTAMSRRLVSEQRRQLQQQGVGAAPGFVTPTDVGDRNLAYQPAVRNRSRQQTRSSARHR